MTFNRDNPSTWPAYNPLFMGHDVGRARDLSTAVTGGLCPLAGSLIGFEKFLELPQGLFGSDRANALAAIDRAYNQQALVLADLSNDPSYAEILYQIFGFRLIGMHIGRNGDGMTWEHREFSKGSIPVYHVGRSFLLEHYHNLLVAKEVRFVDGPDSRRAYQQLANQKLELRETGKVYSCPSGQHDDLGITCAMVALMARHPHLPHYVRRLEQARRPRIKRPVPNALGWT